MFPTSETTGDAEVLPLLPSLKRLHVIHASGGDMSQIFRTLPLLAPNLSHLRFSSARVPLSFLLDFLRNAMGMPDTIQPPPGSDPDVRPSYPSLQYIIVHAVPLPRGGWYGTPRMKYGSVVHVLNQVMACHGQGEGLQLVILKGRAHREQYWAKRAKKDWFDRMTGQRGCWTLQHWVEGSRCTVNHYDDSDDDIC
ncbi:hypothetical protein A0H81_09737 [Grifola frondosa]|uniref:Uncharacterized protein n=1 Tax=Grifola frondosa TaxID=5627 RepID=A0A1C7LZV3_GRIFR|nr:hypothetical protein A0H81_09737 [Grifola frondosa]